MAFGFLIENYSRSGMPVSNPSAEIAGFVVIGVDDSRVTASIRVDPQIPSTDAKCFLYEGVIDVRGMPVLDAIAIFPEHRGADSLSFCAALSSMGSHSAMLMLGWVYRSI